MNKRIVRYSIVIVILGLIVGCGEEEPSNNPPVINSFTASTTEVATGSEVSLTILATDPDGDALTYTYRSTGGMFTGAGKTVTWVAPGSAGDYIITVYVSDGELNAQDLVTITIMLPDGPPKAPEGMALIPAGEFQMGIDSSDLPDLVQWAQGWESDVQPFWFEDETPQHAVYIDAFYIDQYEVTNAQYRKFVDTTGHRAPGYWNDSRYNAPEQPVVGASWHDAVAYAKWAGKRLPTEAEWEKAARGGLVGKKFPWGDSDPNGSQCNFADRNINYDWSDHNVDDGYTYAAPVGNYLPNGYGLYDMAGNVREWCADWRARDYYANSPSNNPLGPDSGSYRIVRGGVWSTRPDTLRAANRYAREPTHTHYYTGFRCVSQD